MLKFQKNVYETLEAVKSAMGTDPTPQWMLIFDTNENSYSAIDYKNPDDIIEYSLRNNLVNICYIAPGNLMEVLTHPAPHEICKAIYEFATLHRPDPDEIMLTMFIPNDPLKNTLVSIEGDSFPDVADLEANGGNEKETSSAPTHAVVDIKPVDKGDHSPVDSPDEKEE